MIGVEELVLVAPPGEAKEAPLDRKDLNDLRFVESPMSGRRRLAERRLQDLGVHERRIAIELGHPEAMKCAVEEGVGAAMLFRGSVQADIERGTLAELRVDGADLSFPVLLLIRKDKVLSRAQAALLGEIRAVCEVGVPA